MPMCEGSVTHGPEYWSSATALMNLVFALWAYSFSGMRHYNPLVRILYPILALNAIGSFGYHYFDNHFFGKIDLWSQMIIVLAGAPTGLDEIAHKLLMKNTAENFLPISFSSSPSDEYAASSPAPLAVSDTIFGISKKTLRIASYRLISLIMYLAVVTLSLAAIVANAINESFVAHIGTGVGMFITIMSLLFMNFYSHRSWLQKLPEQKQIRRYIVTTSLTLPAVLGLWMLYEIKLCPKNPRLWSRIPYHAVWHILGTWCSYILFQMLAVFTGPRLGAAPYIEMPAEPTAPRWKRWLYSVACIVGYRRQ